MPVARNNGSDNCEYACPKPSVRMGVRDRNIS